MPVTRRDAVRELGVEVTRGTAGPEFVVHAATVRQTVDGRDVAVVHGPSPVEAARLGTWVGRGCPLEVPERAEFAVVVVDRADGRVDAAVSSRRKNALFYAATPERLVIGSHPRQVVARLHPLPGIDPSGLLTVDPSRTPWQGVHRLPAGFRLRWLPGAAPEVSRWFAPDDGVLETGSPAKSATALRDAVMDAVEASLPPTGDVGVLLSAGLDSTMLAACAARVVHARGDRVLGLHHAPIEGTPDPGSGWESDESSLVRGLAADVPGLEVTVRRNEALATPLDVLPGVFQRGWLPVTNSDNAVWVHDLTAAAAVMGADPLLEGGAGNAVFSLTGDGALGRSVRAHRWRAAAAGLGGLVCRTGPRRAARAAVLDLSPDPVLRWSAARRGGGPDLPRPPLLPDVLDAATTSAATLLGGLARREGWADFVMRDVPSGTAWQAPAGPVWFSDPFTDPRLVRLVLSLPPEHWLAADGDRGLAREAMRGLVPDRIRLRRERGAQSADAPRWWSGRDADVLATIERLEASPSACSFVDVPALRATVVGGLPQGPALRRWTNVEGRVLALGMYAAWWDSGPPSA